MGLFDYVDREPVECPQCGEMIKEFQSKSGFNRMLKVTPKQLVADCERLWGEEATVNYYGYCENCGCEVSYTYSPEWVKEIGKNT